MTSYPLSHEQKVRAARNAMGRALVRSEHRQEACSLKEVMYEQGFSFNEVDQVCEFLREHGFRGRPETMYKPLTLADKIGKALGGML